MTRAEVLDAIRTERARLDEALRAMGPRVTTEPVTAEGWTAKDVVAHCIHWVGQIAFGMGAPLEPPAYLARYNDRPSGDEWNRRVVEHYRDASFAAVKAELDRRVDALIEQVKTRTDDQLNATDVIPWGGDRPLSEQIGAETFDHWPEHSASIERAAQGQR